MFPKFWLYERLPEGDMLTRLATREGSGHVLLETRDNISSRLPEYRTRSVTRLLVASNVLWASIVLFLGFTRLNNNDCHNVDYSPIFGHIPHRQVTFSPILDRDDGLNETAVWKGIHDLHIMLSYNEAFNGFVQIQNPKKYNLTGGYSFPPDNPTGEIYCISAFHQLHCLAAIKNALEAPSEIPQKLLAWEAHLSHCLPYLRQAIMCSADLTLEKTTYDLGGVQQFGATGWSNVHECRNWDAILALTEEHRSNIEGYNQLKVGSP